MVYSIWITIVLNKRFNENIINMCNNIKQLIKKINSIISLCKYAKIHILCINFGEREFLNNFARPAFNVMYRKILWDFCWRRCFRWKIDVLGSTNLYTCISTRISTHQYTKLTHVPPPFQSGKHIYT